MKNLLIASALLSLSACSTTPMAAVAPPPPALPSSVETSTLVGKAAREGWCVYKDATGRIIEARCKA